MPPCTGAVWIGIRNRKDGAISKTLSPCQVSSGISALARDAAWTFSGAARSNKTSRRSEVRDDSAYSDSGNGGLGSSLSTIQLLNVNLRSAYGQGAGYNLRLCRHRGLSLRGASHPRRYSLRGSLCLLVRTGCLPNRTVKACKRLARRSRWLAILETYLAIGTIVAVLGILFGPKLVEDTRLLSQSLPGLLEKVTTGKIVWQFGNRYGWSYDTQLKIEQFIAAHQAEILAWSGQVGTAVARALQSLIWIVLVLILAIFFLRDGRQFSATLLHIFGELKQRRFLRLIMTDLDVMVAHFIRAQLILAAISLVAYSVVLSALRFPYALVLGFAAGAMEFIPVVGPLVAALVIVFVGFLTGYPHLWALVLFFAVWRVVQDYVVSSRLMGGTLELHPLAAIAAVLMGGELGGV